MGRSTEVAINKGSLHRMGCTLTGPVILLWCIIHSRFQVIRNDKAKRDGKSMVIFNGWLVIQNKTRSQREKRGTIIFCLTCTEYFSKGTEKHSKGTPGESRGIRGCQKFRIQWMYNREIRKMRSPFIVIWQRRFSIFLSYLCT